MRLPWFGGRRHEEELAEELESHIRLEVAERVADGEDPHEARLAALKQFGNVTLTREATRRVWRHPAIDYAGDVWADIRYGIRLLKRSPAYACVIVAVLALGVGANTAVFTLFKAAFLAPLPGVDRARELAVVVGRARAGQTVTVSYPDYRFMREQNDAFVSLSASSPAPFSVSAGDRSERVWGELVSGNYFQALGITARLGRTLQPSDERGSGRDPVAVISDGLWRRAFAADPGVIGRSVLINSQPLTIVGVAEPGFHGSMLSLQLDVFVPLTMQPQLQGPGNRLDATDTRWLIVLGRLRPGVSLTGAAARTEVLAARLASDDPVEDRALVATVVPLSQSPFGAQTFLAPLVGVLGMTSMLVLLIVCTNIANLVLARGLARRAEIAVRLAVGASRARIVRLLLAESLVLAVPAVVAGLLLARFGFSQVGANPDSIATIAPTQFDTPMDAVVVAFATALSWATAILFAFVPALRTSRVPLVAVMKEEGHATGAVRSRTRSALVVVQVAAALLLLVSAGLMMRTVEAAGRADLGFDPSDTVSIRLDLATSGYDENRGRLFYEQLLERLRQTPGVDSASVADVVPLRFVEGSSGRVEAEGYEASPDEDMRIARNVVGPDYFSVLRIGLVTGREFTAADQPGTEPVVVVNETLARRFWQTPQGAIGKRLLVGGDDGEWRTVVGVARDLKYLTLNEGATPYFYMPFSQIYRAEMTVHARGSNGAAALIEPVRSEIARLDANVPVVEARTLAEQARTGTFLYEGAAGVLVAFGVIALLLASVGLYGLVAYTARQRTHEIGIRMAVGAARAEIVRLVLRSGLRLGVVGTAVGIVIALAVTRLMRAMLFGVSAVDPMAFGVALFVVLGAVLLAALGPAMRAARIDPIVALKRQ